jgi:hypothetical protein
MGFISGGFAAFIGISGYWAVLALYDWIDTRRARCALEASGRDEGLTCSSRYLR